MNRPAHKRIEFGGVVCSTLTTTDLLTEIRLLLSDVRQQPRTINCVNAHIHNLARCNEHLRSCLERSRIVAIDGMSVVWAVRLSGESVSGRCNMTEAFREFLFDPTLPKTKGVLIGGEDGVASKAASRISKHSRCSIVETYSGFLSYQEYYDLLGRVGDVEFVFVGMGTPRSEVLVAELVPEVLPAAIGWHIGGGTIEILAGKRTEAPVFLRRAGMQWLYRLCREPKRLWKRYLLGNPLFAWHAARQILRVKSR